MALINCPECGKEISDKAASCPNCGNPMNTHADNSEKEHIRCPKCHSKELHSEQSGFSGGKALAGVVLTGGIGLLAGTIGSKDIQVTCLKCGKKFKAGKALILNDEKETEINKELERIIVEEGKQAAFTYYKNKTESTIEESVEYVNQYSRTNNIVSKNGGCAGVLLLFIILSGSLIAIL